MENTKNSKQHLDHSSLVKESSYCPRYAKIYYGKHYNIHCIIWKILRISKDLIVRCQKKKRRFDCARLKAVATIGFIISFSFFFLTTLVLLYQMHKNTY